MPEALKSNDPKYFNIRISDLKLIFTEPQFNFSSIKEGLNEIFFEEYQFKSVVS